MQAFLSNNNLLDLEQTLSSESLCSAAARLATSRADLLAHLKAIGLVKLIDRQRVANVLARSVKQQTILPPTIDEIIIASLGRRSLRGQRCRIFLLSDLHVEYLANDTWLRDGVQPPFAASSAPCFDVCICSGGLCSENSSQLRECLRVLASRFDEVLQLSAEVTSGRG